MANYPIYRLIKGSTLTFTEMDGNLEWLSKNLSGSQVIISGSTSLTGSLFVEGPVEITGSLANGLNNIASGIYSHAEGYETIANSQGSHAEGFSTSAIGNYSHAEGYDTLATQEASHAEGYDTEAMGDYSHAEGIYAKTLGEASHAEGDGTQAIGYASHAEGYGATASGSYSHAEGTDTQAIGESSHAEGRDTRTEGTYSHAEGYESVAIGFGSHAEGLGTYAIGEESHTEGYNTYAIGNYSHAEGNQTVASGSYQHVQGQFNVSSSAASAFIIGNGTNNTNRSNLVFASGSTFQVTGSLSVSGSINGSLFGTSSWAQNAISSSYPIAVTGSVLYSTSPAAGIPNPFFTDNTIFLGSESGYLASRAYESNFFGYRSGYKSTNANGSNFIGYQAGYTASNADESNFIGYQAGYQASNAYDSNFIGLSAGFSANYAQYSNFIGWTAGANAPRAYSSNFIGYAAGSQAESASYSNFIGYNAGFFNTNASYSIFIGYNVGASGFQLGANNILLGTNVTLPAGRRDSINIGGIIFGTGSYFNQGLTAFAGTSNGKIGINVVSPVYTLDVSGSGRYTDNLQVTGSMNVSGSISGSNALLTGTLTVQTIVAQTITASTEWITGSSKFGSLVTDTHQFTGSVLAPSITGSLLGTSSWALNTISSSYPISVIGNTIYSTGPSAGPEFSNDNSIFLGGQTAYSASNARLSNFIGYQAGYSASNAAYSNFIGYRAGYRSTNSDYSIFIGNGAGSSATNSNTSVFIGEAAGASATYVYSSVFIGQVAGDGATRASYSNFIGESAGGLARSASYSNFIGYNAGYKATYASESILIGKWAGSNPLSNNGIGANNIVIGNNISLVDDRRDSINIGSVIFGTGSYNGSLIGSAPFTGTSNGKIGINQPNPTFNLDVSGSGRYTSGLTVTGSLIAPSITGSLLGTSSWAVSASWAPSNAPTIVSYIATGSVTASVATDISASFRVTSGSNTLLNVTRDGFVWIGNGSFVNQGYQLDVQGTGRFTSQVNIIDSSATNGTALSMFGGTATFTNSGGYRTLNFTNGQITVTGGNTFKITNNALVWIESGGTNNPVRLGGSAAFLDITNNNGIDKITVKASLFRGDTPQYLDIVSNDATVTYGQRSGTIRIFTGEQASTNGYGYIVLAHNGTDQRGTVAIGASIAHTSSILDITSTTQGFLLTRTDLTSNISNPAQGLLTYVTASSTEGLWYYSSGSIKGWTRFLNNTGSQDISGSLTVTQGITGSLQGTSSWAVSASWAPSTGGGTTLNGSGYVSMSGTNVAYVSAIPNSSLANSTITIQGASTALGGSVNVIDGTGFVKASGTSITYDNSTYYLASNPNGYTSNTGTVTSITVSAGTGLSGGGTITTNGTVTLTNAAPDQTVVLSNGTGISVTGTYPNFTIASTVTDTNIYNSDGTLSGNRTIDANGNFLKINNLNTLTLDGGASTNTIALFKGTEPNIHVSASGGSNSAALFLSPSTGFNGGIHNRTGGGLEFYVGATPSLATTIQSTGRINFANYTTTTSFTGTVVGFLGFDASGNILTTTGSGGTGGAASLSGGKTNYNTIWNSTTTVSTGSIFQYSATQVQITGSSLAVGDIIPSSTPGRIDASNDIVSYSTSDIRFKENVKPIGNALSKVSKINGVYFDWIEDIDHHGNKGHDIGVIAQELEQVLPEIVTTRDSGYKAVKYDKIVALLIQAVKEQQVEINELKLRIDGLTK